MKISINPEPSSSAMDVRFSEAEVKAIFEGILAARIALGKEVIRSIEVARAFPFIGPDHNQYKETPRSDPSRRLGKIVLVFLETPQYSNSVKFEKEFEFRLDNSRLAALVTTRTVEYVYSALYSRAAQIARTLEDMSSLVARAHDVKVA